MYEVSKFVRWRFEMRTFRIVAVAVFLLVGMLTTSPVVAVAEEPRVISMVYQATAAEQVFPRWSWDYRYVPTWDQYWIGLSGPGPRNEWYYGYQDGYVVNARYGFAGIPDRPGTMIRDGLEYQLGYAIFQVQTWVSEPRFADETFWLSLRYLEFMPYWITCEVGECGGLVTRVGPGEGYARFTLIPEAFWSLFSDREIEDFSLGVGIVDAGRHQRIKVPGEANPAWGQGAVTLTLWYYR